jgi:hypothetical protein
MYSFREFGFFDAIELFGFLLAVADFSGFSVRLENWLDAGRVKLAAALTMNFRRANPGEEIRWMHMESVARNIETNERTILVHRVPVRRDKLLMQFEEINSDVDETAEDVRQKYGRLAAKLYAIVARPFWKSVHMASLIVSILVDILFFPLWAALNLMNKAPTGIVGTVSFVVAIAGFLGSRIVAA